MRGRVIDRNKKARESNPKIPANYAVVIELGKDPGTGKYKQRWYTIGPSKKEADKRLVELLSELENGTLIEPSKLKVPDYLGKWLNDYAKVNLRGRSFERYRDICTKYLSPALSRLTITQLRPEHLQAHYADALEKGLSARTVTYHHAVIHKALKTACEWGLLNRNVADAVKPPRAKAKEMAVWSEEEVKRFLKECHGSEYYPLFHTALFTGMRRGELLALRWSDIDLLYGQISVSRSFHILKSGKYEFTEPKSVKGKRSISMSPSNALVIKQLKDQRKHASESELVFCQPDGKPLRPNSVTRAWSMMAEKAGLKHINFHAARHSHASLLLRQNVHPKVVQERLGHSSIGMTLDLYSHVAPGMQEAAARGFDDLINQPAGKHIVANS